jgi:carbonic anhydrase
VTTLTNVLLENKAWVAEKIGVNPDYFNQLSKDQTPQYLWIGCSDSRVNPNEITGTTLGEMFVHRNIANVVKPDDLNLVSVLYYGIQYLNIKHVIVCGHHGCGGIMSSMSDQSFGLLDGWLSAIKKVIQKHKNEIDAVVDSKDRVNRLVELNVVEQVKTLCNIDFINEAIKNKNVNLHGWVYQMQSGFLKEMINIDKNTLRKVADQ